MSESDPLAAMGFSRNADGSLKRVRDMPKTPPPTPSSPRTSPSIPPPTPPSASSSPAPPSARHHRPHQAPPHHLRPRRRLHPPQRRLGRLPPLLLHHHPHHPRPRRLRRVPPRPGAPPPRPYDDCLEALSWAATAAADWIAGHADLSDCYLMGTSAGGNIAFHVGLRAEDLKPLAIKGLILHQPFFGGVERTPSEMRLVDNKTFPLAGSDLIWQLSLPEGADRDHEYCNPMKGKVFMQSMDAVRDKKWKVMATSCGGDPLVDRQKEAVVALKGKGVAVVWKFVDDEYHGYDILEPAKAELIMCAVKETVLS